MEQLADTILSIIDEWVGVTIAYAPAIDHLAIAVHSGVDHHFAQFLTELIITHYDGGGGESDEP